MDGAETGQEQKQKQEKEKEEEEHQKEECSGSPYPVPATPPSPHISAPIPSVASEDIAPTPGTPPSPSPLSPSPHAPTPKKPHRKLRHLKSDLHSNDWVPAGARSPHQFNPNSPGRKGHGPPVWVVTPAMRAVQTEEITRRSRRWHLETDTWRDMHANGMLRSIHTLANTAADTLDALHLTSLALLHTYDRQERFLSELRHLHSIRRTERAQVYRETCREASATYTAASTSAMGGLNNKQLHAVARGLKESSKACPVKREKEVCGASKTHLVGLCGFLRDAWCEKRGGVLAELIANLVAPAEGEQSPDSPLGASTTLRSPAHLLHANNNNTDSAEEEATKRSILALAADHLYEQKHTFYPGLSRLELLVLLLYTMAGPDIDSLMTFDSVPDYDVSPEEWTSYAARYKSTRNQPIFSEVNWALRTAPAFDASDPSPQHVVMRKWVKYIVLLSAISARGSVVGGKALARGLAALPESVVGEYLGLKRGDEFRWPALSSCALDVSVSESYISGSAANATKMTDDEEKERRKARRQRRRKDEPPPPPPPPAAILFLIRKVGVGVNLQRISKYPKEAEHLLPIMTCFSVDTITTPAYYRSYLEGTAPIDKETKEYIVSDPQHVTVHCAFSGLLLDSHAVKTQSTVSMEGGSNGTSITLKELLERARQSGKDDSRLLKQHLAELHNGAMGGEVADAAQALATFLSAEEAERSRRGGHLLHTGASYMKVRLPIGALGPLSERPKPQRIHPPSERLTRLTESHKSKGFTDRKVLGNKKRKKKRVIFGVFFFCLE